MGLLGTLLLFFLVGVVIGVVEYWSTLKEQWKTSVQTASRESAERLLADRKRVLSKVDPPHKAQIQEFAFRGYAFYESSQAALERLGFTTLGDFALDQPARTPHGFRSFLRVMRSDDRQTVCGIIDATPYPIGLSGWMKFRFYFSGTRSRHLKAMSLRTELRDGRFIITATDLGINEELPFQILRETVPRDTSASELLNRHRTRVTQATFRKQTAVVPIGTVEEFGQSFVRHQQIVRAFREKIGFALTEKEQQLFVETESPLDKGMAESMIEAMRALENADRKTRAS